MVVKSTNSDYVHRCGGVVKKGNAKGKVHLILVFKIVVLMIVFCDTLAALKDNTLSLIS